MRRELDVELVEVEVECGEPGAAEGTGVDRLRGEPSVLGAFGAAMGLLLDGRAVLELGLLVPVILL